ncbi:hypothetical protein SETIT_7G129000v2 [Setaria italica]|uniref:Uncharacterized protein n=1 Tax=Setaria italica TaxID=4555 RepID=A0A368RWS8_SETIT|nr:hypothetical protein SETIT_7G129000v2 [Setaria italica]
MLTNFLNLIPPFDLLDRLDKEAVRRQQLLLIALDDPVVAHLQVGRIDAMARRRSLGRRGRRRIRQTAPHPHSAAPTLAPPLVAVLSASTVLGRIRPAG